VSAGAVGNPVAQSWTIPAFTVCLVI